MRQLRPPCSFPRVRQSRSRRRRSPTSCSRAPRREAQRAALIEAGTGRTITYAELPSLVDRAAASLARLGIAKGDVCAIFAPNSPEYVIAVLAIARLGAVVTTASPLYTKDDLKKQLEDSRRTTPAHVVGARGRPGATRSRAAAVEQVITFDEPAGAPRHTQGAGVLGARRERGHSAARRHRPRGSRRAALLERHDGLAERRDADAPQPRREHAADRLRRPSADTART